MHRNFFISSDTERSDSVTSFGKHRLLTSQLFQHLYDNDECVNKSTNVEKKSKHTLAARVSLSPDSPTQMFKHNLRILNSRMRFLAFSEALALSPPFCNYRRKKITILEKSNFGGECLGEKRFEMCS